MVLVILWIPTVLHFYEIWTLQIFIFLINFFGLNNLKNLKYLLKI